MREVRSNPQRGGGVTIAPDSTRPSPVRPAAKAPSGRPLGRSASAGILTAMVALVSACAAHAPASVGPLGPSPTPSLSAAAAVTSPSASSSERSLLLSQYNQFWSSLASVSRLDASRRRPALSATAVDPALKSIVAGMEELERKNEVLYGRDLTRPAVQVTADGLTAVVNDCQDSSKAGAANRQSHLRLTAGVARNHVFVTMKKDNAATWKVAFVAYSRTPC